ncbi:MAG TPA: hypothetical protein VF584_00960 [Longimicrobium sp.]|jgi:hypothetical protein
MADINVERKRSGPNILPWLLGLVLLAALIWGAMRFMGGNDEESTTTTTTTESTTTTPSP